MQIAIGILTDPKTEKENELRVWATDVLSKNSPVALTPELKKKIVSGKVFSFVKWASEVAIPTEKLMQKPLDILENLPNNYDENYKRALLNTQQLKELQEWVKTKDIREIIN